MTRAAPPPLDLRSVTAGALAGGLVAVAVLLLVKDPAPAPNPPPPTAERAAPPPIPALDAAPAAVSGRPAWLGAAYSTEPGCASGVAPPTAERSLLVADAHRSAEAGCVFVARHAAAEARIAVAVRACLGAEARFADLALIEALDAATPARRVALRLADRAAPEIHHLCADTDR